MVQCVFAVMVCNEQFVDSTSITGCKKENNPTGTMYKYLTERNILKPGMHRPQAGMCLISYDCFCADVCMCMCVCLPPRLLITSGVMWCDMNTI